MSAAIPMDCHGCGASILGSKTDWINNYPYHPLCAARIYDALPVITEADVRRIVREELARANPAPTQGGANAASE